MNDETENGIFGTRLRSARIASGLSLDDLAKACGVTRQAIWTFEKTGVYPKSSVLMAISKTLNTSIDYLLCDDAPLLPPVIAGMADIIRRWVAETGANCICITADKVRIEPNLKWNDKDWTEDQ